jgi:transposase
MVLRFSTRRFFCDVADCPRRIFAETLPDLAHRHARATPRLDDVLVKVGMECGGEPGRRLCGQLGIGTSGDTILRRLRSAPPATANADAGSIIGVDDFAFRRGQTYGTIVVDHQSGGVIDLLPDRSSKSLEGWLAARPVLPVVITRDRSGVYAKAITDAAPDAIQVADRWHLLANCREVLVRVLDRHHASITRAMVTAAVPPATPVTQEVTNTALSGSVIPISPAFPADNTDIPALIPTTASWPSLPPSQSVQSSIDRRAKRLARYEQVLELRRQGHSRRSIIRELKMSSRQVAKLLKAGTFPERAKGRYRKQVDQYLDVLRARWAEGERNGRVLARHLWALGYTGGYDMVRRYVSSWRTPEERLQVVGPRPAVRAPVPAKLSRPGSHRLSWLLIKDDIPRDAGDAVLLVELLKSCEPIRVATDLVRSFGAAVRERDLPALVAWHTQASDPGSTKEMNGFAEGLSRSWTEVSAAVTHKWSNGRTEGHVNRLKLIKRKMYGRAKLDLLRIRVTGSGP